MAPVTTPMTPAAAWAALKAGNERFVDDAMLHPSQGVDRRSEVQHGQSPFAVLFGCSDSRVAAEIIFDRGLGDLFVVRTAGHVIDTTVVGSIEYGVAVLGTPLVVVLGHDSCGAVAAATAALTEGVRAPGLVSAVVDRVIPSIVGLTRSGEPIETLAADTLGHEHVKHTVHMLQDYSVILAEAVAEGRLAIMGLEYTLTDGRVRVSEVVGDVGEV